jgi:(2Fe-2S) ferredoxin
LRVYTTIGVDALAYIDVRRTCCLECCEQKLLVLARLSGSDLSSPAAIHQGRLYSKVSISFHIGLEYNSKFLHFSLDFIIFFSFSSTF